jgi:putative oxidoreductase
VTINDPDVVDVALLVLRVTFGVFFALHGLNKVRNGLAGTAGWFASIGMKWPMWQARMAAATEITAGLGLAAGLLTPLAAAGMVGVMVVAAWVAHRKSGFFIFNEGGGWEYTASIAVAAVFVGTVGPGRWSLDHALGISLHTWLSGWGGALIAAGFGVVAGVVQLLVCHRPQPDR